MYLTPRYALVRNVLVTLFNGGITLSILLIAPLGLAAVITNTLLIMASTLVMSTMADRVVRFLQSERLTVESLPNDSDRALRRRDR